MHHESLSASEQISTCQVSIIFVNGGNPDLVGSLAA